MKGGWILSAILAVLLVGIAIAYGMDAVPLTKDRAIILCIIGALSQACLAAYIAIDEWGDDA